MPDTPTGFGGVGFGGKKLQSTAKPPSQPKPPNENLTASLRASLRIIENETPDTSDNPIPSPLEEVMPNSVDILLERINNHMIEGKILTDEDLQAGIDLYRSQALKYAQEQETKKPRAKAGSKSSLKVALDLGDLLDEE